MFDAAKETSESQLIAISNRILRPSSNLAKPISQLSPSLLKQSDTVLTSRITKSSPPTNRPPLPWAGPGKFSAVCYRRYISAIGKDPDRNTRSDAKSESATAAIRGMEQRLCSLVSFLYTRTHAQYTPICMTCHRYRGDPRAGPRPSYRFFSSNERTRAPAYTRACFLRVAAQSACP